MRGLAWLCADHTQSLVNCCLHVIAVHNQGQSKVCVLLLFQPLMIFKIIRKALVPGKWNRLAARSG